MSSRKCIEACAASKGSKDLLTALPKIFHAGRLVVQSECSFRVSAESACGFSVGIRESRMFLDTGEAPSPQGRRRTFHNHHIRIDPTHMKNNQLRHRRLLVFKDRTAEFHRRKSGKTGFVIAVPCRRCEGVAHFGCSAFIQQSGTTLKSPIAAYSILSASEQKKFQRGRQAGPVLSRKHHFAGFSWRKTG